MSPAFPHIAAAAGVSVQDRDYVGGKIPGRRGVLHQEAHVELDADSMTVSSLVTAISSRRRLGWIQHLDGRPALHRRDVHCTIAASSRRRSS